MRLYTLKDIIRIAYLKHGGAAGLEDAQMASAARKQSYQSNKETKQQQRTAELRAALAARGLQLRSDSHACHQYINGSNQKTLLEVVNQCMKCIIIIHTKYDYFHEEEYVDWARDDGGGCCGGDSDDEDNEIISHNAKARALAALVEKIGV